MLQIGIVGLPNVGKSTLFNLLAGKKQADAQNFPFCTIEPNEAVVSVPDPRLNQIAAIVDPQRVVPAAIKFVDIAGLVAGAHRGEGLGNQFLSHIRECNAIVQVVRFFEDDNVIHVDGGVDPERDVSTILTELCLADLSSLEKQMEKLTKKVRSQDKEAQKSLELAEKIKSVLENNQPASAIENIDLQLLKRFNLLTVKPFFFVANVSEDQLKKSQQITNQPTITVSAKFEEELLELDPDSRQEFLQDAGITISGLDQIIQTGYKILGLISFFTAGKKEARAWTVTENSKAPQAAGVVHTDFEKKFIMAETVSYSDFITNKGWSGAREKGRARQEGKEYSIQDGDILLFKHS